MKRAIYGLCLLMLLTSLNFKSFSKPYLPINKTLTEATSNFVKADIESDNLISKGKIYSRSDAIELRKNFEEQLQNNPNSIAISLALVKFHSNAPAANGGFKGLALLYATNIYKQNAYLGCLAFEYIYAKYGDLKNAEVWYKNSLQQSLPNGMEWRMVRLTKYPPLGASVSGMFSNEKFLPMYQNIRGSFQRKILVPKCYSDCQYRVIANFLSHDIMIDGKLDSQDW